MKKVLPWILIGAAFGVACIAASWPALRFAKVKGGEFMSHLGALLVFALLIERTVEVFLTVWRAEESYKRQAEVQRLVTAGAIATDPALIAAHDRMLEYRAETQHWAFPISFIIGLLIASFGVRVIEQFVIPPDASAPNGPGENQLWWFHVADIILTAALLAGGADPIHKLMDAFRKFMEASSAKASGTETKSSGP
jgi:uncharacterized protein YacL